MSSKKRKNKKKGIRNALFLIFVTTVMVNTTVIWSLSTPSMTPLIVMMGESPEEKATQKTIQKYHPGVKVVNYRSIAFNIEIFRSLGPVFYIGHGNEEGIQYKDEELSYEQLSQVGSPQVYFLSCQSPSLNSIKQMDAIHAGIFAAMIISLQKNQTSMIPTLIKDSIKRQNELGLGKAQPMFLRFIRNSRPRVRDGGRSSISSSSNKRSFVIPNKDKPGTGLTLAELAIHSVTIIACILAIIAPLTLTAIARYIPIATEKLIAAGYAVAAFSALLTLAAIFVEELDDFLAGDNSILEFAVAILGMIGAVITIAQYIIRFLPWWRAVIAGLLLIGDTGAKLNVWLTVGLIGAAILGIILAIDNLIRDFND